MRIDYAFVLRGKSIDQAWAILQSFKPAVQDSTVKARYAWLAESVVSHIDEAALAERPVRAPLYRVFADVRIGHSEFKEKGHSEKWEDYRFRVAMMPLAGSVYCIVDCLKHKLLEQWRSQPGIEDFEYWDDKDGPEHIPAVDWQNRARIWTKDLAGFAAAPFQVGLTVDLTAQEDEYTAEGVFRAIPDLDTRAYWLAEVMVYDKFKAQLEKEDPAGGANPFQLIRYITSDEGRREIVLASASIRERLLPDIRMEHLRVGVPFPFSGEQDNSGSDDELDALSPPSAQPAPKQKRRRTSVRRANHS